MKNQPKSHQGPRFPTAQSPGSASALFLAMLPLLLGVLLALSGCGAASQGSNTAGPGPCAHSPILGVWERPGGDTLALTSDCSGSRTRCHLAFTWLETTSGHGSARITQADSTPGCLSLGVHECEYEIHALTSGTYLDLDCGQGIFEFRKSE